jgi:hypothetical protein
MSVTVNPRVVRPKSLITINIYLRGLPPGTVKQIQVHRGNIDYASLRGTEAANWTGITPSNSMNCAHSQFALSFRMH